VVGAPSVPPEDLYFKAANTLASTLAGGNSISVLQPGVSVQSGETVRSGPELLPDPRKPSRKEYMKTSAASTVGLDDTSYLDSPTSSAVLRAPVSLSVHDNEGSPSAVDDSFVTNISAPPTASGSGAFRLPDIDIMEGSRRISPINSSVFGEEEEEETATISSNGAGAGSASRLPTKPSDKQRHIVSLIHGGPDMGGNRDRESPISMVPTAARTKLPAPPIGFTTGHGMAPVMGGAGGVSSPRERGNSASFSTPTKVISGSVLSKGSNNSHSHSHGGIIRKERPEIARQIS
jgi:hypothetical protein